MKRLRTPLFVITLITVIFCGVETARILAAIPTPSYSHTVFFRRLWREFARRGHEVVLFTTEPTRENITNLKEIDMSSAYEVTRPTYRRLIDTKFDALTVFRVFSQLYFEVAKYELSLPQVREIIEDPLQHFDVVMVQSHFPGFFGLAHRFKAPFISLTSLDITNGDHGLQGNAAHSILFPFYFFPFQLDLSFKERLESFCFDIMLHTVTWKTAKNVNELNRELFGENFPDLAELKESVDMQFVNNNPLFSPVRPMCPSTISIAGGLHVHPSEPLPKELQQYLDDSSRGVVYFSLGSTIKTKNLPTKLVATLMETFNQLPYNVLWKFEDGQLPANAKNVKILKWAPQQDLLRHKNIKLFITQGGMQSLEEALFAHVPLIIIPFFADQEGNAHRVSSKGAALHLDPKTLTVEELSTAILEVINNPIYKHNMKTLATQILDQPMTALERAVWWTEYLIRHKTGKHLKGPKIPLYQYFYLDIWAFIIGCVLAVLAIVYFVYLKLSALCRKIVKFKQS